MIDPFLITRTLISLAGTVRSLQPWQIGPVLSGDLLNGPFPAVGKFRRKFSRLLFFFSLEFSNNQTTRRGGTKKKKKKKEHRGWSLWCRQETRKGVRGEVTLKLCPETGKQFIRLELKHKGKILRPWSRALIAPSTWPGTSSVRRRVLSARASRKRGEEELENETKDEDLWEMAGEETCSFLFIHLRRNGGSGSTKEITLESSVRNEIFSLFQNYIRSGWSIVGPFWKILIQVWI